MKGFNLDILERTASRHHNALWELEKHFTFWMGLIFGGLTTLTTLLVTDRADYFVCYFFTLILAIVGIFISAIAIRSIRIEGEYFDSAFASQKHAYKTLYKENIYAKNPQHGEIKLLDLIFFFYLQPFKSSSVRNLFQSFWAFLAAIFALFIVFTSVEFVRRWTGVGSEVIPYISCVYAAALYLLSGPVYSQMKNRGKSEPLEETQPQPVAVNGSLTS